MRLATRLVLATSAVVVATSVLAAGMLLAGATEALAGIHRRVLRTEAEGLAREVAYERSVVERLGVQDSLFYTQSAQRRVVEYARSRSGPEAGFAVIEGSGRVAWSAWEEEGAPTAMAWDAASADPTAPVRLRLEGRGASLLGYVERFEPWDWTLVTAMTASLSLRAAAAALLPAALALLTGLAAGTLLAGGIASALARPIEAIAAAAARMGSGDLSARVGALPGAAREIGDLAGAFDSMAAGLGAARAELEARVAARTEELAASLEKLEKARDEIVRREKLAALGGLVAGVAHEVNTPLGVAVTAASFLHDRALAIRDGPAPGEPGGSGIGDFMDEAVEASGAISANLSRALATLASFRELAAAGGPGGRRRVDAGSRVAEILETLRPAIRPRPVALELDIEPGLEADCDPDAFLQVLPNLLMNSLRHGFPEGRSGAIRVRLRAEGEEVVLDWRDDGAGMDAATASRAFEPFFTTRRGEGSPGLGLSIARNAVEAGLGGSIRLASSPGSGTEVEIRFPRARR